MSIKIFEGNCHDSVFYITTRSNQVCLILNTINDRSMWSGLREEVLLVLLVSWLLKTLVSIEHGRKSPSKSLSFGLQSLLNFFWCGLLDKFSVLDEASLFQSHGLWILQQSEGFAICVHNHNLAIKWPECGRLLLYRSSV